MSLADADVTMTAHEYSAGILKLIATLEDLRVFGKRLRRRLLDPPLVLNPSESEEMVAAWEKLDSKVVSCRDVPREIQAGFVAKGAILRDVPALVAGVIGLSAHDTVFQSASHLLDKFHVLLGSRRGFDEANGSLCERESTWRNLLAVLGQLESDKLLRYRQQVQQELILFESTVASDCEVREVEEVADTKQERYPGKKRMRYSEVGERLERLRRQGEPFTSQKELAETIGCSAATVNKAIKGTPSLQPWAKRPGAAPRAQGLNDKVLDNMPQSREPDPADLLSDDDIKIVKRKLVNEAPEEKRSELRESLNSMPLDEQRRVLAEYADSDDLGDRVLARSA